MTVILIILLVLFVLVGLPLIKGYLRLRRYQQDIQRKMEEAMRGGQAGQPQQQRKPSYNKTAAEDAHYEDIPGAKPDEPAAPAPDNVPDDPIIEDAKFEEID